MPTYRAFLLNADNTISPPSLIEADTDEEAIQKAKSQMTNEDVELWEAGRRVAVIKAAYVIRCD